MKVNSHDTGAYRVGLLYKDLPELDSPLFLQKLKEEMEEVEIINYQAAPQFSLNVSYPLLKERQADSNWHTILRNPLSHLIFASSKLPNAADLEGALNQTFDWPEAKSAVDGCTSTIWLSDFLSNGFHWHLRLGAFHIALNTLLELAPCEAIFWEPCQRVVDPQAYHLSQTPGETFDPLFAAYNVRLFHISSSNKQEALMDTLGLSYFELPDLQCHFHSLDLNNVAGKLYSLARYLFDQGPIFEDGNKISFSENEHWTCQHEEALIRPERIVLDLNPGPPYAAGAYAEES